MPGNGLPPRGAALLLGLTAALLLLRLGQVPLVGPDEPRYARVAVEMRRSGDLVTPTLQGRPWLEKPPLYYWMAGASFEVLGEGETAARLPSVLAAVGFVAATSLFAARLYGPGAALHAGSILATALLPFAYGRAAAMDMLLAAAVTAAIALFGLRLLGIAGRLAIPAAYLWLAIATLAKGPLGLLLPGLVVGGFLLAGRNAAGLRTALSPAGLGLLLAVAGPWYALVYRAQGQAFVDVFLLDHNLQRFTSTIHNHPGPFYYYLPVLIAGLFPWSGLVLPGVAGLEPRRRQADAFLLAWLLLPLLFFSAAGSKLPGYVLPCLAPLAIAMGRAAERLVDGSARHWSRPVALVGLALGALAASGPAVLRAQGEPLWTTALAPGVWALLIAFAVSRRIDAHPADALALLRVGGAGLLVLLTGAAPALLASRESGRELFLPARGREVLAWGAWRTAWMAGYFYNDGRVREVTSFQQVQASLADGPALVLCGPAERRRLELISSLKTTTLALGPRRNALLKVEPRRDR